MDPFLGEIKIFAGTFAPVNWHFCDGGLLNISTYQPLFALLATTYGGDGVNNFAVPDLRGRIPIGQGAGLGLTPRVRGTKGGTEVESLTAAQIPAHTHYVKASTLTTASVVNPTNLTYLGPVVVPNQTGYGYVNNITGGTKMTLDDSVVHPFVGGKQAHSNMMPTMALNYIICTVGIYPQGN
jgi:microcystin-dependent protein